MEKSATGFMPAERVQPEVLDQQVRQLREDRQLEGLRYVPDAILVLNEQRQIAFHNSRVAEIITSAQLEECSLFGMRVGEILDCINAGASAGGCGTTRACRNCGAAQVIYQVLRGQDAEQECRIQKQNGEAYDLRVWGTALMRDEEQYVLLAIQDISDQKRRHAMERIFFHDLRNIAGGILGYAELLSYGRPNKLDEYAQKLTRLSNHLVENISAQKDLAAAERHELHARLRSVEPAELVAEVVADTRMHRSAKGHAIDIQVPKQSAELLTDPVLLKRVLNNMLLNALEASPAQSRVEIGWAVDAERKRLRFWVWNPGGMSEAVRQQIFQRSFSTKGEGRGLGTYSMKLLSTRYLGGEIRFESDAEAGTRFTLTLPYRRQAVSELSSDCADPQD